MLFNSYSFFGFLLALLVVYPWLRLRPQNLLLLAASYFFYACWDWRFLSLILLSTFIDFVVARRIERSDVPWQRRVLLGISLAINLGLLAFFKYFGFFVESFSELLTSAGFKVNPVTLHVVLPVGISFYTFQTLSYTIDVYRRKLPTEKSLLRFAVYVAFFPQLVAGPIERASSFLPQIGRPRTIDRDRILSGIWLIFFGLFQKVFVADNLAPYVDSVFAPDAARGMWSVIFGTWLFAFQIYCDFNGYTSIARGVARLLGFELMLNFNLPYVALSPSEFWRRWHISLSTWLRDYLYVPLGGNRNGSFATYRNLMVVMVLGGLWHGAAWNFVIWGVYHGVLLILFRLVAETAGARYVSRMVRERWWAKALAVGLFFQVTCFGWLLFRADGGGQIGNLLASGWGDRELYADDLVLITRGVFFIAPLLLLEIWLRNTDRPWRRPGWQKGLGPMVVAVMVLLMTVLAPPVGGSFLYFQF